MHAPIQRVGRKSETYTPCAKMAQEQNKWAKHMVKKRSGTTTKEMRYSQEQPLFIGGWGSETNREIVSFRLCVCAREACQVEMSLKRHPHVFPFFFWPRESSSFPWPEVRHPLLPILLSSSSWLYRYIYVYICRYDRNSRTPTEPTLLAWERRTSWTSGYWASGYW